MERHDLNFVIPAGSLDKVVLSSTPELDTRTTLGFTSSFLVGPQYSKVLEATNCVMALA